jgi:hypothetical protein
MVNAGYLERISELGSELKSRDDKISHLASTRSAVSAKKLEDNKVQPLNVISKPPVDPVPEVDDTED